MLIDTRSALVPYAPSAHSDSAVREWAASHLVPSGGVTARKLTSGQAWPQEIAA
ncbi:MAG TPA: hypothetical protein VMI74_13270 [Burkholderiales bacterium]|nr:hypothetical protein [Burkholderiales bacterium]